MKTQKNLLLIMAMVMLSSFFIACSSAPTPAVTPTVAPSAPAAAAPAPAQAEPAPEEVSAKKTIGFILLYRRDEWYKEVERVALETAANRGLKIEMLDSDYNSPTQITQIESLTTQKVDAIALAPTDPSGPLGAISEAAAKGIPVFAYDTGLDDFSDVISYVAFNNYEAGYQVGIEAAKFINEQYAGVGKVGIISFPQNALVHGERVRGFKAALTESAPNAEIVSEQDGQDDRSKSMSIMENILTSHNDIAVMFGANPDTQYGIIAALEAKNIDPAKVFVCGEGWGDETLKWIAGGQPYMKACFVTPPNKQAASAVNAVADYLEGKPIEATTYIQPDIVTSANAVEYFAALGITLG